MSLLSHFYAGSAQEIASAIQRAESLFDSNFESLDLSVSIGSSSGMFADDIEAACRVLTKMREGRARAFKSYVGKVLEGTDDGESQVILLKKSFASLFSTLTDVEALEVAERIRDEEFEEAQEDYRRQMQRLSRVTMKPIDYAGLVITPVLAFGGSAAMGVGKTAAWVLTIGATAALYVSFFFLWPWWERKQCPAPRISTRTYKSDLLRLAEFCRKTEAQKVDLAYEWSL